MNEREIENVLEYRLRENGWNDKVGDINRNVYRRTPRTEYEIELLRNSDGKITFPDYILYESNTSKNPIAIIEVKTNKFKNLLKAKEQGMEYAIKLKSEFLFLFNKNSCKAIHVPTDTYLIKDNEEVSSILPLETLKKFNRNIFNNNKEIIKTKQDLIDIFNNVNDKLREAGITIGIQRFTEFSNLLFLKLISELNLDYKLPKKVLWESFKNHKGETLLAYINDTVIPTLNSEFESSESNTGIFEKLKIKNTIILEQIIEIIDKLDFNNLDFDIKGDAFEYFMKKYNQRNNDLGEYFTPRHIVKFLVNLLNPKIFEKIYDPFCGTGGMLIHSFKYIYDKMKENEMLNQDSITILRKQTLYGSEISETAKIAKMNMILTGDGHSNVLQQDTFINPIEEKYDVVITNIPFNLDVTDKQKEPYDLDINSGNSVAIQHILKALSKKNKNSRACIIVPEGISFDKDYITLREKLVKEKWLDGIISLPSNVFLPYTETRTSILIISGMAATKRDYIYFYKVKNDGYTLTTRRKVIGGINDLDEFIDIFYSIKDDNVSEFISDKFKIVDRKKILENNNKSLQVIHYHDDDKDNWIRLASILKKVNCKNILQFPTATITNNSFWGVDLGENYWGNNFQSVTSESNVEYTVLGKKEISFNPSRINVGSIGINMSDTNMSVSKAYPVYKITNSNFLPEYVYLQLRYNLEIKDDIKTRCYGTVRQSLSVDDFTKIQIPIKSLEEQLKIVNEILNINKDILKFKEKLSNSIENNF
ncbi:N-6 DNA methylase [Fusobacterium nucleatum]|uniref:N-6 DNA methylase n=1 Tax=Fusobacterium nucleatum TaxID=851 RepID=UPI0030CF1013